MTQPTAPRVQAIRIRLEEQMAPLQQVADALGPLTGPTERIQAAGAQSRLQSSRTAAARELNALFGGYSSSSVFVLAPGSPAYKKLLSPTTLEGAQYELAFTPINIDIPGDTNLMVVQETPTYFRPRQIQSDPTKMIQNALAVLDRVLRAVGEFVPGVSGVAAAMLPLSQQAPGRSPDKTAAANETVPLGQAQVRLDAFRQAVDSQLADHDLTAALDALRAADGKLENLKPEQRSTLVEKVRQMEGTLGVQPTTQPTSRPASQPAS